MSPRVGSTCDELDWENWAHTFYLSLFVKPIEKLELSGTVSYTLAEAEMDSPDFSPQPPFIIDGKGLAYDPSLMNDADDYSDLDYSMLEVELTGSYQITKNLSFSVNYWYSDFEDDEPYVYGDLDGEAYSLTGFITWTF